MIEKITATLCLELSSSQIKTDTGTEPLRWRDIPAVITLSDAKIICSIEVDLISGLALSFIDDEPKITQMSIFYHDRLYGVNVGGLCYTLSSVQEMKYDGDNRPQLCEIKFSLLRALIPLVDTSSAQSGENIVFSGVSENRKFDCNVKYKEQPLHIFSSQNSDIVTISSEQLISQDLQTLFQLCFSLYQNAEIRLLEQRSSESFILYPQLPPPAGTQLSWDASYFNALWTWLANEDKFLSMRNSLDFFLAGTRSQGEYLDFRLINLLICMNSICPGKGEFGSRLSSTFGLCLGDGFWLAYVRNNLLHEGKTIEVAIDKAFIDYEKKQKMKIERFAPYKESNTSHKSHALYFEIIDIITAYFVGQSGYHGKVQRMRDIFSVVFHDKLTS